MEKPEKVQSSAGYNSGQSYYRADEMDPYIAELKSSLAEMADYANGYMDFYCDNWGTYRKDTQDEIKADIDRARALLKEVEG